VAVVLALKALLHLALSLVSLALGDFALPYQAPICDPVQILWLAELYNDAGAALVWAFRVSHPVYLVSASGMNGLLSGSI
jgi:hypothetical protein